MKKLDKLKKNAVRGSHYTALNGRMISVYWTARKQGWPNLHVESVENYEKCQ
jgi:hypothetical protein